ATLLQDVNDLLRAASGPSGRMPTKLADLDRVKNNFPRGYEAVKSGNVVVLWGSPAQGEGDIGKTSEAVVAYEKQVPTEGGHVLLSAGSVKKMTADEFAKAPKAGKPQARKRLKLPLKNRGRPVILTRASPGFFCPVQWTEAWVDSRETLGLAVFVDRVTLFVKGGDGGNGCCSFRREKYVPKGGPDGGDGGDAGSVIVRAVAGTDSLADVVNRKHWRAESGGKGGTDNCT